jgi:hypothetical protein
MLLDRFDESNRRAESGTGSICAAKTAILNILLSFKVPN